MRRHVGMSQGLIREQSERRRLIGGRNRQLSLKARLLRHSRRCCDGISKGGWNGGGWSGGGSSGGGSSGDDSSGGGSSGGGGSRRLFARHRVG